MKANIGLSDANAQAVGLLLNGLLADEQVLYHKVRNYHWNVTGTNMNCTNSMKRSTRSWRM